MGRGWLVMAAVALALWPAGARASGPYATDDAAIAPAGTGQVESWVEVMRGRAAFVAVPAFTWGTLPAVEWSVGVVAGPDGVVLAPSAKFLFGPEVGGVGDAAFSASVTVETGPDGAGPGAMVLNGIVTVQATDWLLVHANAAMTRALDGGPAAGAWAGRLEAMAVPARLVVHAELFGDGAAAAGKLGLRPLLPGGATDLELALVHGRAAGGTAVIIGFATRF